MPRTKGHFEDCVTVYQVSTINIYLGFCVTRRYPNKLFMVTLGPNVYAVESERSGARVRSESSSSE